MSDRRYIENIRQIWRKESTDFTPWLADNLHLLGRALNLKLEPLQTEASSAEYSLDILARETERGVHVVIENQLEWSNHIHLGQLLTYLAHYDAKIGIWVALDFTDGHQAALERLNLATDTEYRFYGVQIAALCGDPPQPQLIPVVTPEPIDVIPSAAPAGGISVPPKPKNRRRRYTEFFNPLKEQLAAAGFDRKPRRWLDGDFGFASGVPGVSYNTGLLEHPDRAQTYLLIDSAQQPQAHAIYRSLVADAAAIERELLTPGPTLSFYHDAWRVRGTQRFSMGVRRPASIDHLDDLEDCRAWLFDWLQRLRTAMRPRLAAVCAELSLEGP